LVGVVGALPLRIGASSKSSLNAVLRPMLLLSLGGVDTSLVRDRRSKYLPSGGDTTLLIVLFAAAALRLVTEDATVSGEVLRDVEVLVMASVDVQDTSSLSSLVCRLLSFLRNETLMMFEVVRVSKDMQESACLPRAGSNLIGTTAQHGQLWLHKVFATPRQSHSLHV
jgi:hypothetical protein